MAGDCGGCPVHYNSSSPHSSSPLFFFSTLGPLHSSHHLTHYTIVCLLLCLSHHRGLPRIHSVLTSPICVSLSASPFCIAVPLISTHLYSHPLIPSVHWLLFNVLFNSFVSPVSLQLLNNIHPTWVANLHLFHPLSPFSSLSSILLSFYLQNC